MPMCNIKLYRKPCLFCLYTRSFKVFIPSQGGRSRDSFIPDGVSSNAWPITLLISTAAVKRLIDVTWSPIHSRLSQLHLFPVVLLSPSPLPVGLATKILMTSLTSDPSVGNYNICRHDKAAHKDGSGTLFWGNFSSPAIMSGFRGRCRVGGVVWVAVEGVVWPLCGVKRGRPTTQTDMLTANTNIAKQMVHAYLFRFPFKCTPQLCESALSSIEGRTYQLPSSLLTIKRTFHLGTMRGLLLSLGPESLPHHV